MNYRSILFPHGLPEERVSEDVLKDLHIDTVLERLSHGPDMLKYDTCYLPLKSLDTIYFRHDIFKDLKDEGLYEHLQEFQTIMDNLYDMDHEIDILENVYMKQCCLIERALLYCDTVVRLYEALQKAPLQSEGMVQFREDLGEYVHSHEFEHLQEHSGTTSGKVYGMKYLLHLKDNRVELQKYQEEKEYGREIVDFFSKFVEHNPLLDGRWKDSENQTRVRYSSPAYWQLDPIQSQIIDCLTELFPEPFSSLAHFMRSHRKFIPPELTAFHEDIGFYLTWMEYIKWIEQEGLPFCYPSFEKTGVYFEGCFDLILAERLLQEKKEAEKQLGKASDKEDSKGEGEEEKQSGEHYKIICNHLMLLQKEHILVLTGPNQGGKTTYARMFGQLFYFASLGVPVPGNQANLFLPDRIFTHFEREEDQASLNGKLRDDMVRIHDILEQATSESLILINEMFASTTLQDAEWLGRRILELIKEKGVFCLYVTFINELASALPTIVSLISQIGEGEERTYKIVRGSADGRAYANSIVKKYQLSHDEIIRRLKVHKGEKASGELLATDENIVQLRAHKSGELPKELGRHEESDEKLDE